MSTGLMIAGVLGLIALAADWWLNLRGRDERGADRSERFAKLSENERLG